MLKILKFYLFPIWFPLFIIFFILLLILSTFVTTKIYLISLSSICLLINIILKIIAKFKNSFNFDIRIVFIINRILFIVFLLLGIYNVSKLPLERECLTVKKYNEIDIIKKIPNISVIDNYDDYEFIVDENYDDYEIRIKAKLPSSLGITNNNIIVDDNLNVDADKNMLLSLLYSYYIMLRDTLNDGKIPYTLKYSNEKPTIIANSNTIKIIKG